MVGWMVRWLMVGVWWYSFVWYVSIQQEKKTQKKKIISTSETVKTKLTAVFLK